MEVVGVILIYVIAIILFILVLWNWLNNQFKSLRNLLGELIKGNYSFELKSKKTDFVLISFMPLIKELKKKLHHIKFQQIYLKVMHLPNSFMHKHIILHRIMKAVKLNWILC